MNDVLQQEMQSRNERYAVPELHKAALEILNDKLKGADDLYDFKQDVATAPPIVFVLGLPRSWTTLCVQLLTSHLDVASVTNIAAKFWNAPVTGMIFSRMLDKGKRDGAFMSDYGKTDDPFGPHEFSYFWHHWFKMDEVPYIATDKAEEIDWKGFNQVLANMAGVSGKPLVLKAMDAVYHLPRLLEAVERSICVYVERDLREVAASLTKGRMDYYGNLDEWFSIYPPDYPELVKKPWFEQVACQVHAFWKMHEDQIGQVDERRVLRFRYEDVCDNPQALLDSVSNRLHDRFGCRVGRKSCEVENLSPRNTPLDPALEEPLLDALRKLTAQDGVYDG